MLKSMPPDNNDRFMLYIETDCECHNRKRYNIMAGSAPQAMGMAWDIVEGLSKHTDITLMQLTDKDENKLFTGHYEYGENSDDQ